MGNARRRRPVVETPPAPTPAGYVDAVSTGDSHTAAVYLDSLRTKPKTRPSTTSKRPMPDKSDTSMATWVQRMSLFSDDPDAIIAAAKHNHKKGF